MNRQQNSGLRIVWAITQKDLVDSIKNKHMLSVILPVLAMILIYRFIPVMNSTSRPTRLRLVSSGNRASIALLEQQSDFRLIEFETTESLQYGLTNEELPEIALALPVGFDDSVADGSALPVQGYMLDFFSAEQVRLTVAQTEAELEAVFGTPVLIHIETIPLQVDSYGITILTSMALTFGIIMVGLVAMPNLMLEEKDEKTLDFMLVSPARPRHIVLAKSISGMAITLGVYLIALIIYRQYFVHWWLAAVCGLLGAAFSISLGLSLGILVDTRQKLTLYGWIFILPLFLPILLVVMDDLIPEGWAGVLNWFPSVAVMRLVRTAMAGRIRAGYYLPQISTLVLFTAIILLVDTWLVRRMDR